MAMAMAGEVLPFTDLSPTGMSQIEKNIAARLAGMMPIGR